MSYQKIITADGSITLHSDVFQEACHSTSGARAETIYNYVEGCEINRTDCHSILEIGFGVGLGLICTDDFYSKNTSVDIKGKKYFVTTEIDEKLLEHSAELYPEELTFFPPLKSLKKTEYFYHGENHQAEILILIGDARKTLQKFYRDFPQWPKFDAIYQDAFSPKKNPLLWSQEWFHLLGKKSCEKTILITYSSAQSVRKALEKSSWQVEDRAGLPPKKTTTRAFFKNATLFEKTYQRDTIPDLSDPSFPKLF